MFTSVAFLWSLLGVILIASEMIIPGFVIFFFGAGAVITGIASLLLPPVASSFALQGLLWAGASVFSLLFLRRRFSRIFRGTVLNKTTDADVGNSAVVSERITPESPGRVRYMGTTWRAISYTETFEPGASVEILREDKLTLVVSKPILEDY